MLDCPRRLGQSMVFTCIYSGGRFHGCGRKCPALTCHADAPSDTFKATKPSAWDCATSKCRRRRRLDSGGCSSINFLDAKGSLNLTRVWPINQALDHGDAGEHHERAISLAAEAGLEEEYASARLGEPSWLTDPKLHLFDKKGQPINGRALCPLGCKRLARGRQVTTLRTDCDKRQLLVDLAYAEHQRRKALAKYWKAVFASGEKCCRTMRRCPLAAYEDRPEGKREEN